MKSEAVKSELCNYAAMVEAALASFASQEGAPKRLQEAMRYSLLAGGKRLRPVLCLTTAKLFGCESEKILPFACAIEMIHTYSLIHDDLPAMDNDDLRRGRPSNHKAFDEATAILAGDALQADAFFAMTQCQVSAERIVAAIAAFAKACGSAGMCGGQQLDMQATNQHIELEALRHLHALKTGAILQASVTCGAILAGASAQSIAAMANFGMHLGVAFQIADDILDIVSDTETLGKPVGSDESAHKSTYPALVGLEQSRVLAREHAAKAIAALEGVVGHEADFLRDLAIYTVERAN